MPDNSRAEPVEHRVLNGGQDARTAELGAGEEVADIARISGNATGHRRIAAGHRGVEAAQTVPGVTAPCLS